MCDKHGTTGISRRGLTGMLAAGAGLALSPLRAATRDADLPNTMCIMCIDHNFVEGATRFFNSKPLGGPGVGNYDLVGLAGASLAAKPDRRPGGAFRDTYLGLREQVLFAMKPGQPTTLHPDVKHIVVLDHLGCGAYKDEFPDMPPEDEFKFHLRVAGQVQPWFTQHGLTSKFWIIKVRGGPAERFL